MQTHTHRAKHTKKGPRHTGTQRHRERHAHHTWTSTDSIHSHMCNTHNANKPEADTRPYSDTRPNTQTCKDSEKDMHSTHGYL